MKKNCLWYHIVGILAGAILIILGLILPNIDAKIVGTSVGIGSALLSGNLVYVWIYFYYKKHPAMKKQNDINIKDERTVAIATQAKAKTYDLLINTLIAIPFLMILAGLPLWSVLTTIALYVLAFCVQIYFTIRLQKEM